MTTKRVIEALQDIVQNESSSDAWELFKMSLLAIFVLSLYPFAWLYWKLKDC